MVLTENIDTVNKNIFEGIDDEMRTERISLTNILKIISMRYDHFMRLVRMKVSERGRMLVGEEHMGLAHALVQHGYNQNNVLRVPHIHRATLAAKKYHKIIKYPFS